MGDFTSKDIRQILVQLFVLVISVAIHEFGHAIMADKLGDDTPRRQGRVTLNPIAHADPVGTLMLPLISGVFSAMGGLGGIGWGRPVQWQPSKVNRKWSMATASILVAIAGPGMNFVLGTLTAAVHVLLVWRGVISHDGDVSQILGIVVGTNYILMFFNLLPFPPLDGGHVAQHLMPYRYRAHYDQYAKFAPFALLVILFVPQVGQVFSLPAEWLARHVYMLLQLPFGG